MLRLIDLVGFPQLTIRKIWADHRQWECSRTRLAWTGADAELIVGRTLPEAANLTSHLAAILCMALFFQIAQIVTESTVRLYEGHSGEARATC